jgi:hypothetical protein
MSDHVELISLIENPPARRLWLLHNALRSLPFERAVELSRIAEAFVTGSPAQTPMEDAHVNADPLAAIGPESNNQSRIKPSGTSRAPIQGATTKRRPVALRAEDRERLLGRLAEGARTADLANEFGLTSKGVQGIRMGCAREIAKRREQLSRKTMHSDQTSPHTAWVEDVVRYLRQQDDVIVSQENGNFLVNGRFEMPLADLVGRANRMRARQQKPAFELMGAKPVRPERPGVNGHPGSAAPGRAPDGILRTTEIGS